ncbi:MAG: hypothetical protein H7Z72_06725 [Bacteroidetes bacterium]|nr:hypothetical protein [Fibrella sp.]
MKTNATILIRPLAVAALLLTIFAGLSSCNPEKPVKPKSVYGPILPAVMPDTLVVDPNDPKPIFIE